MPALLLTDEFVASARPAGLYQFDDASFVRATNAPPSSPPTWPIGIVL